MQIINGVWIETKSKHREHYCHRCENCCRFSSSSIQTWHARDSYLHLQLQNPHVQTCGACLQTLLWIPFWIRNPVLKWSVKWKKFWFFFLFFSKKGNCKRIRNFYCIFVRHIYVYTFNFLFVLGWGSGPPPKEFEFRWPTI